MKIVGVFLCCFVFFSYFCFQIMNMRRLIPLILAAGIMMLAACKEKKQTTDIITTKYVPKQLQAPIAMAADQQTSTVRWQDAAYTVSVSRVSVDSLPMVKDEYGQKYIDNRVDVNIARQDGSVFFRRSFTKNAFAPYVDATFRKDGILAGIRYDEVKNAGIEFSVVIALPDALDDMFVPLEMVIDRQGGISISRDDDMDMLEGASLMDEGEE